SSRTALLCLLGADVGGDLPHVLKLADQVIAGDEKHPLYRSFVLVKGLAESRAGRHKAALEWLERLSTRMDGRALTGSVLAVRAMALHHLGQPAEARQAVSLARALLAKSMPDPAKGRPFGEDWTDWLDCQVLLREAEALLKK